MIEEVFLTLVKYMKEIEFKINPLHLICDKDYNKKWNDRKEFSKLLLVFTQLCAKLSLYSK